MRKGGGLVTAPGAIAAQEVPVGADAPETVSTPARKERPWLWYLMMALTVLFLVTFSVVVFRMRTTIEQQNQQLVISSRAFRELTSRSVDLRNELARKEEVLRILSARHIGTAELTGFGISPVTYGKIFWDTEKRSAVLLVANLPVVPEGKVYQLWIARGTQQVSAGVFAVTAGGSGFFRVDTLPVIKSGGPSTIAVTLEQKGGSGHPTGAVYLTGTAWL